MAESVGMIKGQAAGLHAARDSTEKKGAEEAGFSEILQVIFLNSGQTIWTERSKEETVNGKADQAAALSGTLEGTDRNGGEGPVSCVLESVVFLAPQISGGEADHRKAFPEGMEENGILSGKRKTQSSVAEQEKQIKQGTFLTETDVPDAGTAREDSAGALGNMEPTSKISDIWKNSGQPDAARKTAKTEEVQIAAPPGETPELNEQTNLYPNIPGSVERFAERTFLAKQTLSGSVRSTVTEDRIQTEALTRELMQKLVVHIQEGGDKKLMFRLQPEHLGKIEVEIRQKEGHTEVEIRCFEEKTLHLLGEQAEKMGAVMRERLGADTQVLVEKHPGRENDGWQGSQNSKNQEEQQREQNRQRHEGESDDFIQQLRLGLTGQGKEWNVCQ